jgi:dTDP-glucose 4,6-dehydratase
MILKALEGEPLPVYGDGGNVRDWLFVDDHAAALECILRKGRIGETYNVGGRSERKNLDVVQAIVGLVDELAPNRSAVRSQIEFVTDRPGHDRRYAIDCSKIETELGWRSTLNFEAGMRRTVQWYLERRDWWEPLRARFRGERLGLPG